MNRVLAILGWVLAVAALAALGGSVSLARMYYVAQKASAANLLAEHPYRRLPPDWATAPRRLLLVGDSRMAQWSPLPAAPGLAVGVSARGGETLSQLAVRLERDVLDLRPRPDRVVLAMGINDLVGAALGGLSPTDAGDQVAGRLLGAAERIRAAGLRVTLLTILPPAEPDPLRRHLAWNEAIRDMVERANARLARGATERGIDLIDVAGDMAPDGPLLPEAFAADTLHFTPRAYGRLNALLLADPAR